MLIKTMKLRLDELVIYLIVDLGGFLFGHLLLRLAMHFERGEPDFTVFRMGTVMAWILFCLMSVMLGMFATTGYFNGHVGFSRTRKSFFLCDLATEFCWNLLNLLFIWGFSFIEGGILKTFYRAYPEEFKGIWGLWLGWVLPALALALAAFRELTGALILRFGKKVFWVMWGLWMIICIVPGKIGRDKNGTAAKIMNEIAARIKEVPLAGWAVMGVLLLLLLLAVSWMLLRKQAVEAKGNSIAG